VFGKRTVYCNDIGCYTLGYGEPLHSCDVLLCMGSSISQASGLARVTGKRTVAYIGDSTFFHSGLPALANAVKANDDVTVVVLDNYITAMTGHQPSLTTGATEEADAGFSIEAAARGVGARHVYSVDPFDCETTLAVLKEAKDAAGVSVVVSHGPCVVEARRRTKGTVKGALVIDQELCNGCSLCVRVLGCPAILVTDGEYRIDEELCVGCGLCADVCNRGAIQEACAEGA
jgi:indolepyruvate ferredoxin oxidoreductase alpha subunit